MPRSMMTVRRVGRPSPSKGEVPKPPVRRSFAVGKRVVEDHGAVVDHGDVLAGDLLAELAGEHGALR
jgi:hypothetical protein